MWQGLGLEAGLDPLKRFGLAFALFVRNWQLRQDGHSHFAQTGGLHRFGAKGLQRCIIGGTEADTVINSGVMFTTDTGTGDDIVHNSGTINLLSTDAGSDTVTNDDGILTAFNLGTEDDTLIMAGGLANGTGGAGADSFVFTVGGANLTVFDYEDADIIEIDGALGAGYSVNVLNPDGSSNGIGLADNSIGNGNSQVLDLLIETFSWGARITFEQSATGFSLTQAPTTTITLYGDDATDFSLSDLVFV